MFQPYLKASIRHVFKAPVHFDPDLIATEGETFPSGSAATGRTAGAFAAADLTKAAALEGMAASVRSRKRRDPSPDGRRRLSLRNSSGT
ncbi:hypothetical protein NKH73_11875 [Mesorhizobium sp. M0938]|uniref:hypothetical protein n=1 Tax=unclassified Mesorhizobium TaxID=325217 RepID=UPI003337C828